MASSNPFESLTLRKDFDELFATGTRRRFGSLTFVRAQNSDETMTTRVAVIAGRRTGNAVQRNRAKRRIREALRGTSLPSGENIAVVAGPGAVTAPFDVLSGWIEEGLRVVD